MEAGITMEEHMTEELVSKMVCGSMLEQIKCVFACKENDIRAYSPLTLAYIGDAVYDLIIRTVIVERGNRAVNELHRRATRYVNAPAQARMIEALLPSLTEEEEAVYRRGRNAKPHTTAKNATVQDYRKATGMEALLGYLYLNDKMERVLELCRTGIAALDMTI